MLAIGYRLPFDVDELFGGNDTGLGRLVRGLRGFLPAYLREPAYAILAGSHGLPLHRERRELIWEMPLGRPLRGVQRYEIAMRGTRLEWSSGGRSVPFSDSLQLDRLAAKAPHAGSMTFFTNGSEVQYSRIEVRGRLSAAWVDERVAAIVDGELTRIEQLREASAARE